MHLDEVLAGRHLYYMSLFAVGRGGEKIKDIGEFRSMKNALAAASEDFIFSAESQEEEDYNRKIVNRDFQIGSYKNDKGETIWDIGSDETAYVSIKGRYPTMDDL